MKVLNFILIFPGHKFELFKTQKEFSARLSEARKQGLRPSPKVIIEDMSKPSGNRWLNYTDYKKLKKEEEAV